MLHIFRRGVRSIVDPKVIETDGSVLLKQIKDWFYPEISV